MMKGTIFMLCVPFTEANTVMKKAIRPTRMATRL